MVRRLHLGFWLALILIFCACVALKLNGSSVGMWSEVLNEPGKPHGLLVFTPKQVRADEWESWTPAALSQARQTPQFPIENVSLGGGRAPLLVSVPVAYYTTFFRPQLWGFFLFDFERGFSFYWCCKVFGLLLASAWLLQQMGCRSRSIILIGTLWIFFSGYVQWWFSSPAMLPEMLATWTVCTGCVIMFFKHEKPWQLLLAVVTFVFCGVNFALCLYPPYQIPLLFLTLAILIGTWFEGHCAGSPHRTRRGILLTGVSVAAVLLALAPFWFDVKPTLELVAQTDYPGARRSLGGDLSLFQLLSGLVGFFQTKETIPAVYNNICEASNFYPLWPVALFATFAARWRRLSTISPLITALGVLIISLSIFCVAPLPNWLLRSTLLCFATERRTLLAIGLANIFLCCVFAERYRAAIFTKQAAVAAGFIWCAAIVALLWITSLHEPKIFPDHQQIAIAVIINVTIITLFFWETIRPLSLIVFVTLLVFSNAGVNPIMRGLSPLLDSEAFREIQKFREMDPTARWIVYHDFVVPGLVIATGAPVLNGDKAVPDFTFLRRLDPSGGGDQIYNRYGFIECELPEDSQQPSAHLLGPASYVLYLPPDYPFLDDLGVRYALFSEAWTEAELHGYSLVREITRSKIWIYHRRYQNSEMR